MLEPLSVPWQWDAAGYLYRRARYFCASDRHRRNEYFAGKSLHTRISFVQSRRTKILLNYPERQVRYRESRIPFPSTGPADAFRTVTYLTEDIRIVTARGGHRSPDGALSLNALQLLPLIRQARCIFGETRSNECIPRRLCHAVVSELPDRLLLTGPAKIGASWQPKYW